MALAYDDAIESLTDSDVWMSVGMTAAGYAAPWMAAQFLGDTIPPVAIGLGSMAASEMFAGSREFTVGSGAFTLDKGAERLGFKSDLKGVMG